MILEEDDRSNLLEVCVALSVEHESRHEAFKISFAESLLNELVLASTHKEVFELVNGKIAVFVFVYIINDVLLKSILVSEFLLEASSDLS